MVFRDVDCDALVLPPRSRHCTKPLPTPVGILAYDGDELLDRAFGTHLLTRSYVSDGSRTNRRHAQRVSFDNSTNQRRVCGDNGAEAYPVDYDSPSCMGRIGTFSA